MPGRNGTGPMGRGALTGRGMGICTGTGANRTGAGQGMGLGLGCRRGFGAQVVTAATAGSDAEAQKAALTEQKNVLERQLEAINNALEKL